MGMLDWAKQEIELAKKRERGNKPEDEWDYGCACYDSALKAFESLLSDGHSGMSIWFTNNILNRLINGKALTPIEDTDDIWKEVYTRDDGAKAYQCRRMSSLFKEVHPDGKVEYHDNNYVVMENVNTGTRWSSCAASEYIYSIHPIKFPYIPTDKPYIVYQDDFLYKKPDAVGEYDHYALMSYKDPEGKEFLIDKYFMETEEGEVEISKELWEKHKAETFGKNNS